MSVLRLALLFCLMAGPVLAHGTLPGGGGFVSGALHPFVALEHLLVLLAAGLILGRDGLRWPLWALFAGLGAGLGAGMPVVGAQVLLLVITLACGALLALQVKGPGWACAIALLAVGLAVGSDTELPPPDPAMAAAGAGVAVFLITMNAFALAGAVAGSRVALALRVAGAWMLAAALMVLALSFRGLA